MIISRIAPTPNGYLHVGNAISFIITAAITRKLKGKLRLRLDDLDSQRIQDTYIEDIFRQLDWLGIETDDGPATLADAKRLSQRNRIDRYLSFIDTMKKNQLLYACNCSRKEIRCLNSRLVYQGICRNQNLPFEKNIPLRIKLHNYQVKVKSFETSQTVDLTQETGDFIIRRRDGLPAYHIASLCDDIDFKTNLIIRGQDLLASSAAQLTIAKSCAELDFQNTNFIHHPLISSSNGEKLSKSRHALALALAPSPAPSLIEIKNKYNSPVFLYRIASKFLNLSESCKDLSQLVNVLTLN